MRIVRALSALAPLALGGCVQLVALGQPIVGQPDEIAPPPSTAAGVCDDSVAMGTQAFCDLSCAIDPTDGASTCGERLIVTGQEATLDVTGLHELEVVVNACAEDATRWSLTDEGGASVTATGAALEVRAGAGQVVHQAADFVPSGECAERSVVLQHQRLELVQADRRFCDVGLLRLPQGSGRGSGRARWRLSWSPGVRAIELCLRNRRAN